MGFRVCWGFMSHKSIPWYLLSGLSGVQSCYCMCASIHNAHRGLHAYRSVLAHALMLSCVRARARARTCVRVCACARARRCIMYIWLRMRPPKLKNCKYVTICSHVFFFLRRFDSSLDANIKRRNAQDWWCSDDWSNLMSEHHQNNWGKPHLNYQLWPWALIINKHILR